MRFLSSDRDFESSGKILSRKDVSEGVNLMSSRFRGLAVEGTCTERVEEEGVTEVELGGKEDAGKDF